jgi:glycosyltransferase involved in cell wall biosynthesis
MSMAGDGGAVPLPPDTTRPLRILMVLEGNFTQRGGGGAESQVKTLATHLRHLGHRVTVVTPMLLQGPQVAAERCYGVPVGRLRYPRRTLVGAAVMCLRMGVFLWKHRKSYDAWHVHIGHHLGAVTCLVGSWLGKPVIVKISGWWELDQGVMASRRRPFDILALRWLKKADVVQATSTRIAHELQRQGFPRDRILVLSNAVDTSRFRVRPMPRTTEARFTAVFVGRLVPEKGLDTLFDGWAQSFHGRADVRLRLVGEGGQERTLREQAERLGIASQVEFLGHCDHVEDILAEADVGVLPSRIEGLSNTLLEFMASGLPTLASRVSGSEDFIVSGRNGWLFPVSDAAALADCLRDARSLPVTRLIELGRQARADVEAASALDRVVGQLLLLYRGAHPRDLRRAD